MQALGNRSLLANPGTRQIRDRVDLIKQREARRPLAPSLLAEEGLTPLTPSARETFRICW
ncbi:hypothetical protein EAD89_26595 [Micromonospora sp. BL4]|nr:hypothetical protein EAD89_26595 [Micromonospora sp. BL4]